MTTEPVESTAASPADLVALTMTPEAGRLFLKALNYAACRIVTSAHTDDGEMSHEDWLRWGASRLDAALLAAADGELEPGCGKTSAVVRDEA